MTRMECFCLDAIPDPEILRRTGLQEGRREVPNFC